MRALFLSGLLLLLSLSGCVADDEGDGSETSVRAAELEYTLQPSGTLTVSLDGPRTVADQLLVPRQAYFLDLRLEGNEDPFSARYWLDGDFRIARVQYMCVDGQGCNAHRVQWGPQGLLAPFGFLYPQALKGDPEGHHWGRTWSLESGSDEISAPPFAPGRYLLDWAGRASWQDSWAPESLDMTASHRGTQYHIKGQLTDATYGDALPAIDAWSKVPAPALQGNAPWQMFDGEDQLFPGTNFSATEAYEALRQQSDEARQSLDQGGCPVRFATGHINRSGGGPLVYGEVHNATLAEDAWMLQLQVAEPDREAPVFLMERYEGNRIMEPRFELRSGPDYIGFRADCTDENRTEPRVPFLRFAAHADDAPIQRTSGMGTVQWSRLWTHEWDFAPQLGQNKHSVAYGMEEIEATLQLAYAFSIRADAGIMDSIDVHPEDLQRIDQGAGVEWMEALLA